MGKELLTAVVPLSVTAPSRLIILVSWPTALPLTHRSNQPDFQLQRAAVYSKKNSDKPPVHLLPSTKQQIEKVSD